MTHCDLFEARAVMTDLLALMHAGDLTALDQIARTWSVRLLTVARRQCHLSADAEDAVQQALLLASTRLAGVHADGNPLAWLSTLVARTCARLNRKASRHQPLGDEPCGCDEDPAVVAEQHELQRRLEHALQSLARIDRLAVLLSAEGRSGPEIAEHLGLSHDAVRGRLKRARRWLREQLTADDTPGPAPGTSAHDRPAPLARLR